MALKAETKTKLKALGLDPDKLIAAITAEAETDYEVPEVQVFTQEQLDTRDTNKAAEGKDKWIKEGEKQGKELAAKAIKKKFGIEDESKDLDKVAELVNAKVATGDAGLREQNAALLKDKEALTGKVAEGEAKAKAAEFDSQLIAHCSAGNVAGMTPAERLMIIKANMQFEEADGKVVVKRNGEILKDKATHAPIPVNQAIADYHTERNWTAPGPAGGRGGSDNAPSGGAGLKKLSQVQEDWKKTNPDGNVMSAEFQAHLTAATKDIPDFDYYN